MTAAETAEIRAWMAIPENIGALHRALLATPAAPLDVFDPFGVPPPFAGRLEMIGMGETRLEDAYGAAVEALEGFPLFTMTQALRLIGYFGDYKTGDWTDKARHAVAKNAYRLRERGEPNNRIEYLKRQEIIYARTEDDQRRWHPADKEMIVAALDRTEERVARVVQGGGGKSTSRRGSKSYGASVNGKRRRRGWKRCVASQQRRTENDAERHGSRDRDRKRHVGAAGTRRRTGGSGFPQHRELAGRRCTRGQNRSDSCASTVTPSSTPAECRKPSQ